MKATKILIKTFAVILMALTTISNCAYAQESKKDRQTAKTVVAKDLIDSQNFVFVPQFVFPLRGRTRNLTSNYDLVVSKDSIISYLPYFGRAYAAPINSSDIGFKFTTTDFDYKATPGKKNAWNILIKPKTRIGVQQLSLQVFENASASLNISSADRDPISYQGFITERKQGK